MATFQTSAQTSCCSIANLTLASVTNGDGGKTMWKRVSGGAVRNESGISSGPYAAPPWTSWAGALENAGCSAGPEDQDRVGKTGYPTWLNMSVRFPSHITSPRTSPTRCTPTAVHVPRCSSTSSFSSRPFPCSPSPIHLLLLAPTHHHSRNDATLAFLPPLRTRAPHEILLLTQPLHVRLYGLAISRHTCAPSPNSPESPNSSGLRPSRVVHTVQPRSDQHGGVEIHLLLLIREDGRPAPWRQRERALGPDDTLHRADCARGV